MEYLVKTDRQTNTDFRTPEVGVKLEDVPWFYRRTVMKGFNAVLLKTPRFDASDNAEGREREDAAVMFFLGDCGSTPWMGFSFCFDEFSGGDSDRKFEEMLKRHDEVITYHLDRWLVERPVTPPVPIERVLLHQEPHPSLPVGYAFREQTPDGITWRVTTGEGTTREAQPWEVTRLNRFAAGWENLQHRMVHL
jgi:hypothetical protein